MEEEEGEIDESLSSCYLLSLKNQLLDQAGLLRALEDKEASIQRLQGELESAKAAYTLTVAANAEGPLAIVRANLELQQVTVQLEAVKAHNEQLQTRVNNCPDEKVEAEIAALQVEIAQKEETAANLKGKLETAKAREAEILLQWEAVQKTAFDAAKPLRRQLDKAKRLQLHLKAVLAAATQQMKAAEKDLARCKRKRAKSGAI